MNVLCSAKPCPVLLSTTCVFYEGENLIYTGINTNDSVQVALQKIDETFSNAILDISAILPISVTAGPNPIISISQASATSNGYISSTDWNIFNNKQNTVSLTTVGSTGPSTFNSLSGALNVPDYSVAFPGFVPTSRTLTINGTSYDLTANRTWNVGTVTSVGITMPPAFNVSNSPITSSGVIGITAAGLASQYVRGDGFLGDFPSGGGGGSAVSYYLNGSVNQGTFGGSTYYEINKTPVIGGPGTNFSITNTVGLISQFITDPLDPGLLLIPAGNWNIEFYFNSSDVTGAPYFYVELYIYNGTTFTLISSGAANPEYITNGTSVDIYFTSIAVPETIITVNDRFAIRVYGNTDGNRTITLHTEGDNLSQIVTTFSNGLTALNGLTRQVQYFATGTAGTDFAINSSIDIHTFNLPTASATNRGALSSADWSTFSGKISGTGATGQVAYWNGTNSQTGSNNLFWDASNARLGIGTNTPSRKLHVIGTSALFQNAGEFELDLLNTTSGNYLRLVAATADSYLGTIQNIPLSFIMNGSRVGQFTSTNGNLILQNGGTFIDGGERFQVNGTAKITGNTLISAGNLSIFTTNTPRRLNINQALGGNAALIGLYASGGSLIGAIGAQPTTDSLQFAATAGIVFYSGSTIGSIATEPTNERMRITSGGNLLVGTTTDSGERLQVNGTMILKGVGYPSISFDSDSSSTTWGLYSASSSNYFAVYNGTTDVLKFATTGTATFSSTVTATTFYTQNGGDFGWGDGSTFIDGDSSNQFIRFIINSSERARFNPSGNLLLGTTTDSGQRLQVQGNAIISTTSQLTAISSTGGLFISNSTTSANGVIGLTGAGFILQGKDGASTAYPLLLQPYGSNVGIGTSTPSYLLDVNRSSLGAIAQFITNDGTYNPRLLINGTTDGLQLFATFSSVAGALMFGTGNTEKMRLTSGGNLLVGTSVDQGYRVQITGSGDNMLNVWGATAPSIRLDNAASGATQRFVIGLATATNNFIQGASAGDVCITTASASPMVFGMWQTSTASEVMRITTSNNLLINKTTDGGQKLQVSGKVNFASLPTSSAGLSAGDIWNNGGVLNIV